MAEQDPKTPVSKDMLDFQKVGCYTWVQNCTFTVKPGEAGVQKTTTQKTKTYDLENDDLENDDLENNDLENDDLENDDLENNDLENDDLKKTAGSGGRLIEV